MLQAVGREPNRKIDEHSDVPQANHEELGGQLIAKVFHFSAHCNPFAEGKWMKGKQ